MSWTTAMQLRWRFCVVGSVTATCLVLASAISFLPRSISLLLVCSSLCQERQHFVKFIIRFWFPVCHIYGCRNCRRFKNVTILRECCLYLFVFFSFLQRYISSDLNVLTCCVFFCSRLLAFVSRKHRNVRSEAPYFCTCYFFYALIYR